MAVLLSSREAWEPEQLVPGCTPVQPPVRFSFALSTCSSGIAPASLSSLRRAQAWKGDLKRKLRGLQAAEFSPSTQLRTPQEATVIVAEERRTRRCRLQMGLEKGGCACSSCAWQVRESRALFFRHPDEAGGQSTRSGAEFSMAADPWAWVMRRVLGPAAYLVLPRHPTLRETTPN